MTFEAQIKTRFKTQLALLALVMVSTAASGCQSDDADDEQNSNIPLNNGSFADSGVDAASDASGTYDVGGDTSTDATQMRRYEPALAELGPPASTCPTPIVGDASGGDPSLARVFMPNYRVDFDVLSSHQSFREHIHQLVHEKVLPCRDNVAAAVVVFPESMGLPMLLIGDKASRARQMNQSTQALTAMVSQVDEAFAYYGELFPDTSTNNRFLLAMTDSVVRATYDTFGQIADRYDIFVSVTVNLPAFEKTTDPAIVERLGDPDYDVHDYVYQATAPEVYNRQILFGPDGEVVDETLETYITGLELDQLDLAAGEFTEVAPVQTPWGRTGVSISKSAWMPDVQDRLDDLGAQVIFHPQASIGGWTTPLFSESAPTSSPGPWKPDHFLLGAWNMVQRSPRATHGFVAQLTGNFFELATDGQVQFIEKASRQSGADAFVGQHGPLSGNTFVGPWVIDDPIEDNPELTLLQRRDELRRVGEDLLPGSGAAIENEYVRGMWAADIEWLDEGEPVEVQTHPQIASFDQIDYVVSSKGVIGERRLSIEQYDAGVLVGEYEQSIAGFDLIRPAVAVGNDRLHVVAELVGDGENRLAYFSFDPAQSSFVDDPKLIAEDFVGRWAFHPAITVHNQVLHISWIQRVGDTNRAYYGQTSLDAAFESMSVNTELESRPTHRPELRANQWDARVAVGANAIAVTWIDFKNWQWEVLVSVSTDGGLDWSNPVRVDAVPEGVEALNSTPSIAALGNSRFMIAWTDARATRPNTRIASRTLSVSAEGAIVLDDANLIGDSQPYERWMWRPTITHTDNTTELIYEVLADDRWALERVSFETDGTPTEADEIVASSASAKHFATAQTTSEGTVVAFEEVPPHSGTASSIEVEMLSP